MDSSRKRRIVRLVTARSRLLDAARGELGRAQRALSEAADAERAAQRAWTERAEAVAAEAFVSVDAIADSRAHLEGLRRRAEVAAAATERARTEEQTRRDACIAAEREVKKVEIWRDKIQEAERAIAARQERVTADEIAARTFAREGT
jgi:flagellar biosynthesis chaperone FliJ